MMKLLIADDEVIIRETISSHIPWASLGIKLIGTAANGLEAYDMIMDEYPDIVMTDIKMPGLSGLELLKRIKKIHPDVEFIILSGYGEFEFAREAMQWGVRHYLLKPSNPEQIISSVSAVMADIQRKRALQAFSSPASPLHNIDAAMILNLVNEGVARETAVGSTDFQDIYAPYRKFLDFEDTPYELCHLYFVDEAALQEAVSMIRNFHQNHAPGISFHILYVHQTLLFFFRSYYVSYKGLDAYMEKLTLGMQAVSCQYQRCHYGNLEKLLDEVIPKIKRYETIYYDNNGALISICNYRNVTQEAEALTLRIYAEPPERSEQTLHALFLLLFQITNAGFLKQLASSIIMLSTSKCLSFSALEATEFMLEINQLERADQILERLMRQLKLILQKRRESEAKNGSLSAKIDEYVRQNLSDCNLSLKWVAEHYLYMNVDYVSKRFLKETGKKFSNYLTDLRIQKAKELLTDAGNDKIQSVAEMVGFGNNPQYFSQMFKKATGKTPSTYIKFISGGQQNDK